MLAAAPVFACTKGRRHQQQLDDYDSRRQGHNGLRRLEAERVLDRAAIQHLKEPGTRELGLLVDHREDLVGGRTRIPTGSAGT